MKTLQQYITERLNIKKTSYNYNYFPETKEELQEIIKERIDQEGPEVDLNDIDVSNITDMSILFQNFSNFNGDISNWDVSNVNDMSGMFLDCESFNQDISAWDVSNVKYKIGIFTGCPIEEKHKPKFK